MGRVIVDVSPSLDGYLAGRGVSVEHPFGDAGPRLHRWMGADGGVPTDEDRTEAARMFDGLGAVVLGRTMFDVGIDLWGDDGAWGCKCYVVSHRPQADIVRGPTTFTFVDGVEHAVELARQTAGTGDVLLPGGADIVQQALWAGLVDEVRLHLVPVLLGSGVPLFREGGPRLALRTTRVVVTPNAVHQAFEVIGGRADAPLLRV